MVFRKRKKSAKQMLRIESAFGKGGNEYANIPLERTYLSILINDEDKLAHWIFDKYGEGYYNLNAWGWIKRKGVKKCTIGLRKKLCSVEIFNMGGDITYYYHSKKGLRSYGFWRNPLLPKEEIFDEGMSEELDSDTYWYS